MRVRVHLFRFAYLRVGTAAPARAWLSPTLSGTSIGEWGAQDGKDGTLAPLLENQSSDEEGSPTYASAPLAPLRLPLPPHT